MIPVVNLPRHHFCEQSVARAKSLIQGLPRRLGRHLAQPTDASYRGDVTLVTGASHNHWMSLIQLLNNLARYEPGTNKVVFDLGLPPQARRIIEVFHPWVCLVRFPFAEYPDWMRIRSNAGHYAWKAPTVRGVVESRGGIVFWIDAGCLLTGPMDPSIAWVRKVGAYAAGLPASVGECTHVGTLHHLNVSEELQQRESLASGFIGFDTNRAEVRGLLGDWARLSQDREAIAPEGSSKKNHRQDQSLLSILFHEHGFSKGIHPERLNWVAHQDID